MAILKAVGRGFLYILGLPLFLVVLLFTAVGGLFMLIFMFFKSIVLFFTGRSLNDDLPEDKRAKEIKEGKKPTTTPAPQPVEEQPVMSAPIQEEQPIVQTIIVTQQQEQAPSEVDIETIDPISQPVETENEPVFEEEPETELPSDFAPVVEEEEEPLQSNDEIIVDEKETKETNIGQYTPHTDKERFFDEVDVEEEEDTGVDII